VELRESNEQVYRQEKQIAHESNIITPATIRNTAIQTVDPGGCVGYHFLASRAALLRY